MYPQTYKVSIYGIFECTKALLNRLLSLVGISMTHCEGLPTHPLREDDITEVQQTNKQIIKENKKLTI